MKIHGTPFKNSETCEGVSFPAPDISHDLSIIRIAGRYPENGWAMNKLTDELVYIEEGSGTLSFEDTEEIVLEKGDVVSVPKTTWFAWNGNMNIIMTCQPAFNPKQYKIKE